jgi:hypothetical protein
LILRKERPHPGAQLRFTEPTLGSALRRGLGEQ